MSRNRLHPNILFLLIDSARADHFSCLGYRKKTTPFMDSLAEDGVLFENAISPSGSTKPSMYCIFTGMHLSKVGNGAILNRNYRSIAEILKEGGYQTGGISHNPWVSTVTQLDRGFENFWFWDRSNVIRLAGVTSVVHKLVARKFLHSDVSIENVLAKKFIKQNLNRPFFLYVHYGDLHHPYDPPERFTKLLLDQDISMTDARHANKDAHRFLLRQPESIPEKAIRILQNLYDAELAYMDFQIQNLIEFLDAKRILNNTLVIITADHGDNLGEAGLFSHKFILNEPLIHVPLIFHLPGYFSGGIRAKNLAQTIDILPTILTLTGISRPETETELQGFPLPQSSEKSREIAISERIFSALSKAAKLFVQRRFPECDLANFRHHLIAVRNASEKFVWSSLGHHELYNLANDPYEQQNIFTSNPNSVRYFEEKLNYWRNSFIPYDMQADDKIEDFDQGMIKQLRALGYVD